MAQCKECGANTLPGQEYCMNCSPSRGNPGHRNPGRGNPRAGGSRGRGGRGQQQAELPSECILSDSFYEADGSLKRKVNIDAAEKAAECFRTARMTQTSIRQLFNHLKGTEMQLRAKPDLPDGFVRERYDTFLTQTEYQVRRGVIPSVFAQFVRAHKDVAVQNKKEFVGFVKYLTAILARMRVK